MIPLRDSIPNQTTPVVSYVIIVICLLAFFAQLTSADGGNRIVEQFGMIPARVSSPEAMIVVQKQVVVASQRGTEVATIDHELAPPIIPPWMTIVTCMFLHGGWMHFLGNMWFLYVFGDNVEDRFGRFGFAIFYLATGIAAGLAHYATATTSIVPTIGASGAIAGVMGAYAVLYPHARVQAVLPLLVVMPVFVLPAPIFLGIWFVIQTYSGIAAAAQGSAGGVAWWAHVGGFAAGAVVAAIAGRIHPEEDEKKSHRF